MEQHQRSVRDNDIEACDAFGDARSPEAAFDEELAHPFGLVECVDGTGFSIMAPWSRCSGSMPNDWSVSDYYRWYVGIVVKGRRLVYVNAVHKDVVDHRPRVRIGEQATCSRSASSMPSGGAGTMRDLTSRANRRCSYWAALRRSPDSRAEPTLRRAPADRR